MLWDGKSFREVKRGKSVKVYPRLPSPRARQGGRQGWLSYAIYLNRAVAVRRVRSPPSH